MQLFRGLQLSVGVEGLRSDLGPSPLERGQEREQSLAQADAVLGQLLPEPVGGDVVDGRVLESAFGCMRNIIRIPPWVFVRRI